LVWENRWPNVSDFAFAASAPLLNVHIPVDWWMAFKFDDSAFPECVGVTTDDPVGATFGQIHKGSNDYVVWNALFYDSPSISGCGDSCNAPA